jgi:glutamate N-acetyltransferase/amino-acid N-acetyltransferase
LVQGLAPDRALDVAQAMMTTDTFPKIISRQICSDSNPVTITGMAKGAGMIAPNMATMLCFLLCDARVEQGWLRTVLRQAVELSFNRLTVDGDTSTNDSVLALFNGAAGPLEPRDLRSLEKEIRKVCLTLARAIAQDAEGGTKILKITVTRAKSERQALMAARTVGNSPLVKTAMYGRDPNWGRIVAALGRSGAEFDPDKVCVSIGGETIFSQGRPVEADWDAILKPVLAGSEISIDIDLQAGRSQASVLASDFTEEYIRINASYRT